MGVHYVDTSALVKLIRTEPESAALIAWLSDRDWIVGDLHRTELRRAARRVGPATAARAERLLEHIGDPSAAALREGWVAAAIARPRAGSWHDHYAESFYLAYGEHEPQPVPFAALTGAQRGLVEHLVRHPDALIAEPEQMPELLRRHALPDSHPGLAAYAAGR